MEYFLYRHIRKDNQMPFYIGVGKKPKSFNSFEQEYKRAFQLDPKKRTSIWEKSYQNFGCEVEIMMESKNRDFVFEKEKEFIKMYGKQSNGGFLVNLTDGGLGMSGVKLSKEWIEKRTKTNREKGNYQFSEVHLSRMLAKIKRKEVQQLSEDGEVINEFKSITEAAKAVGVTKSKVSQVCLGHAVRAGKFKWKFKI